MLLSGQDGPAYFLIPVLEDVIAEDRELLRALAKASLRNNWKVAQQKGKLTNKEMILIEEIRTRRSRR